MIKDYRGRVRFTSGGYRYEVTNGGLVIYKRTTSHEYTAFGYLYEEALHCLTRTASGRHKLELALRASRKKAPAKPKQFTTAIHIPPHMRAVRTTNNQTRTT